MKYGQDIINMASSDESCQNPSVFCFVFFFFVFFVFLFSFVFCLLVSLFVCFFVCCLFRHNYCYCHLLYTGMTKLKFETKTKMNVTW